MTRDEFGSFMFGAFVMLMIAIGLNHIGEPYQQYMQLAELKKQCEATLPRNEHCVIVVVPPSKD